jgi:hypothetical protein
VILHDEGVWVFSCSCRNKGNAHDKMVGRKRVLQVEPETGGEWLVCQEEPKVMLCSPFRRLLAHEHCLHGARKRLYLEVDYRMICHGVELDQG